ncbi:MAG TPA: 16S rRNA (cytidine(1402)-2'-O)-methyltransferase [Actinomycetota bacterium]|nr:16S rRNA (cytidine(1402)-2'-O)-methyltransferase [Actinomycetota bacterium]
MAGTLWLVGTPIGNLGDFSARARETLARVDVIACEDTRRTRALLTHFEINAPRLVSFFDGNERRRIPEILKLLREGSVVALVSDAGNPGISDPGYLLVAACVEAGLSVDAIPGPSAAITALVLSGLPTDRFVFEGFLPRSSGARRRRLTELAADPRTLIFYESPRRVVDFLKDALDILGDRRAAVARELTKLHQDVIRGRVSGLARRTGELRGELVVVLEGAPKEQGPDLEALAAQVEALRADGLSRRAAAARVANESGVSKRTLYERSLRVTIE